MIETVDQPSPEAACFELHIKSAHWTVSYHLNSNLQIALSAQVDTTADTDPIV